MPRNEPKPLKYDANPDRVNGKYDAQVLELQKLMRHKTDLEGQLMLINQAIATANNNLPSDLRIRAWKPCVRCQEKTQDRFGTKPLCAKHVAGGNETVARIMEDLIYGQD